MAALKQGILGFVDDGRLIIRKETDFAEVDVGDYIVKGFDNSCFSCEADTFEYVYELVEE